jgi:hypothetical protein
MACDGHSFHPDSDSRLVDQSLPAQLTSSGGQLDQRRQPVDHRLKVSCRPEAAAPRPWSPFGYTLDRLPDMTKTSFNKNNRSRRKSLR